MYIIFLILPSAIVMISLIGNIVLTIWFCTLLRSQITREEMHWIFFYSALHIIITMLVFLMNLSVTFLLQLAAIPQTVIATLISSPPLLVFGYMCYSFRTRANRPTNQPTNRQDIQTAATTDRGLETAHWTPRFRITTTDTDDHAPTIEPSEKTPLIIYTLIITINVHHACMLI